MDCVVEAVSVLDSHQVLRFPLPDSFAMCSRHSNGISAKGVIQFRQVQCIEMRPFVFNDFPWLRINHPLIKPLKLEIALPWKGVKALGLDRPNSAHFEKIMTQDGSESFLALSFN